MAVKMEIRPSTSPSPGHELALGGDPKPYHTGRRNGNNKKMRIRNFDTRNVRLCFRSIDGRPIDVYFESPLNIDPADSRIGWAQITAASSGGFKQKFLVLHDDAWGPAGKRGKLAGSQISVSASLLSGSGCDFHSTSASHVEDIIIDGGN